MTTTNPSKTEIMKEHVYQDKTRRIVYRTDVDGLAEAIVRAGKSHDTFQDRTMVAVEAPRGVDGKNPRSAAWVPLIWVTSYAISPLIKSPPSINEHNK